MIEAEARTLIERTLPPVWSDLWSGRDTPQTFRLSAWARPHTYFLGAAELEAAAPGLTGLCPLIERNGEAILGWLPDGRFVQVYYEDGGQGDAAIEVLGRNYQEFVLFLLLELEDAGLRDEWVEFARVVRFAHMEELVDLLDNEADADEALAAFRDRIAGEG
jgi:hypothetical protein